MAGDPGPRDVERGTGNGERGSGEAGEAKQAAQVLAKEL